MSRLHDRPTVAVLARAVRHFLENAVTDPRSTATPWAVRVAAHAAAVIERELELGAAQHDEHAHLLAAIGVGDEGHLAAAIRSGALDGRLVEVAAAVRRTVRMRLAVDHPGYDEVGERE